MQKDGVAMVRMPLIIGPFDWGYPEASNNRVCVCVCMCPLSVNSSNLWCMQGQNIVESSCRFEHLTLQLVILGCNLMLILILY